MKIPPVFGRPIQGVRSVLAVAVQPGAKLATPAVAAAFFPQRISLPRRTRGLFHHSAAIPPQTHSNSELSSFKARGIINSVGLTSLGHHPIHRPLLPYDLSGRGGLLGSSVLATEAWKGNAMHLSEHGVLVLRLIGPDKCGESMGNLIFDASQASFQQPVRCSWRGKPLVEVMGSS